jgi:hypothetical protein
MGNEVSPKARSESLRSVAPKSCYPDKSCKSCEAYFRAQGGNIIFTGFTELDMIYMMLLVAV